MTHNVIDKAALTRLLDVIGGDIADLQELIEDFSVEAPALVNTMQQALTASDTNSLRIAAHSLKSNARDMGAIALAEESAALEQACGSGEVTDAAAQVAGIAQSVTVASTELEQIAAGGAF